MNSKLSVWAAAREGDLDGVKAAVENGADIEERGGLFHGTGLYYACWRGCFSTVDYLIHCGAKVNCRDNNSDLPIHYACESGHLDTVKLIISKGSDFTSTNNYGRTPLHVASLFGHRPVVDYFRHRSAEAAGN